MTLKPTAPLRSDFSLLSPRIVLQQIGLGLIVFLLSVAWLRIPDASILDVIGTILLALIILTVAGGGESWLILHLSGTIITPKRLLRGTLLVLAGVALWFLWTAFIDHLQTNDSLRAGYYNSRFPASMRNVFSYEHIYQWLEWMWTTLEWIGAGIIALFVFAATASIKPLRAMLCALRSITYWIVVVLGSIAAIIITNALVDWLPGHNLRVELVSLILRLSLATLVDATIICLMLAVLAACVREADTFYITPAGTPDTSHPRIADIP
jgi:hypothetical protein